MGRNRPGKMAFAAGLYCDGSIIPKKIVFVGDAPLGKTKLLEALMGQEWDDSYIPTAATRTIWEDYEIWDTPGQERLAGFRSIAYPGTDIFVICFSMERKVSLENVPSWVEEIMEHTNAQEAVCLLVGTKSDMEADVTHEDAVKVCWPSIFVLCVINMVQMAKAIGACPHVVTTSSKTGAGVEVCVYTART